MRKKGYERFLKNVRQSSGDSVTARARKNNDEVVVVSDATLRRGIGYNIKRAFNLIKVDLVDTLKPHGLRMLTYTALVLIVDNPGLRQTQLAQAMDIEHPNLVKILDELENDGLVTRMPVKTDRRSYALHSSKLGRKIYAESVAAVEEHEASIFSYLNNSERDVIISAMQQLLRRNEEAKSG